MRDLILDKARLLPIKMLSSPSLMMAFSNLARAAAFVLPLPVLYTYSDAAAVAFWLALSTIVSMQSLLFLGLPSTLVRALSFASAGGDFRDNRPASLDEVGRRQALRELCQFMKVAFLGLSAFQLAIFGVVGTLSLLRPAELLTNSTDGWIAWAVILSFSPVRSRVLEQLTFLNGVGNIACSRMIDGVIWSASGLLGAIALWLTQSLAWLALAASIPALMSVALLRTLINKEGWGDLSAHVDWTAFRRTMRIVWGPAWRAGIGTLISTGARQGTGLMLAQVALPPVTAAYLLAQNVITLITLLSGAPVQARLHDMARAYAEGALERQKALLKSVLFHSLMVAAIFSSAVCIAVGIVGRLGVASAFVSLDAWVTMAIALLFQRFGAAHLQSYSVTNHIIWHWLDGVTGGLNIVISIFLLQQFGIWAVIIGNLASCALFYYWIPVVYSSRLLGMPVHTSLVKGAGLPFLILAGSATVGMGLQYVLAL